MDRLRERCPVALAVSLHAPNDPLRDQLVPINRKYPIKELLAACERYLESAPRDFITFEYVMLDGVNDSVSHARELVQLVTAYALQIQPDPIQPFPQFRLRTFVAGSGGALSRCTCAGWPGNHRTEDARR